MGALLESRVFLLAKEWRLSEPEARYYLDGNLLSADDRARVDQFLALISFRYIPNRVLPLDVIRGEHGALRDMLARRLSSFSKSKDGLFAQLSTAAQDLVRPLDVSISAAAGGNGQIRLNTPTTLADVALSFGYSFVAEDVAIEDAVQGSGMQSLLMLQTLALIDRDRRQQFGWRQAAVWALEEPESSLHLSLELAVAKFLADITHESDERLQILATTHSDVVLQFADRAVFLELSDHASVAAVEGSRRQVVEKAATSGISRWVHPILMDPLKPVVIVEGKTDKTVLDRVFSILGWSDKAAVTHLGLLTDRDGGVDDLLRYVREHAQAIRARLEGAPVLALIDWDSRNKLPEFQRHLGDNAIAWLEEHANPELGQTFRGIERFMPTWVIDDADAETGYVARRNDGVRVIERANLEQLKSRIARVVETRITESDIAFLEPTARLLAQRWDQ